MIDLTAAQSDMPMSDDVDTRTVLYLGPLELAVEYGEASMWAPPVAPGQYYWVITAVDSDNNESYPSNEVGMFLEDVIEEPTPEFGMYRSHWGVVLKWGPVPGAVGYQVYQSTTSGSGFLNWSQGPTQGSWFHGFGNDAPGTVYALANGRQELGATPPPARP